MGSTDTMDIDEYLKQKKSLEDQKKILEGKEKILEQKQKTEKRVVQPTPASTSASNPVAPSERSRFSTKTLLIINVVILLGVLGVFTTFYLFPPGTGGTVETDNSLTGAVVATGGNEEGEEEEGTTTTPTEKTNETENESESGTTFLGPAFSLTVEDVTEGPFNLADGTLKSTGKILSIMGTTYYNDFEITILNEERDKIICFIDRKIDLDKDLDGKVDVEGVYSLDRHKLKIKPAFTEKIQAGIGSVPTNIPEYEGKGEVRTEYEARCYFCLDDRCDTWEEQGEATKSVFFRVRINEDKLITPSSNGSGNQTN